MKSKLFTTLVIFASLALTACGGKTNPADHVHTAADDAQWQMNDNKHWKDCKDNDGGKVGEENHKWVSDTAKAAQDRDATCSQAGIAHEKCSVCGKERERNIPTLDHNYGSDPDNAWADKAGETTCGAQAHQQRVCTVCNQPEERANGVVQHTWVESNEALPAGDSGYRILECSACHAKALAIQTSDATLGGGASRKTAPEGCTKLSPDNGYMEKTLVLTAAKAGKFYLRGAMDYWYEESNNNQNRDYYSANSGHTDKTNGVANFKLEVGADDQHFTAVPLPENKDMKFGDVLPRTVGSNEGNHQWSIIGDMPVGAFNLPVGTNLIRFTRIDSFNLAVKDFLFVLDSQPAA